MMLLMVQSLSADTVFEVDPLKYQPNIPKEVLESKSSFIRWCKQPTTKHCFISGVEGVDPGARVSGNNPPMFIHGLIGDYDAPANDEILGRLEDTAPSEFLPIAACQTYSKNARLVWQFEEPCIVNGMAHAQEFMKVAAKALKLNKFLAGFDRDAFLSPSQYYEVGLNWRQGSGKPIPGNFTNQWSYLAGDKVKDWGFEEFQIPIKDIEVAVQKKFPGKWKGSFELGARGTRFWDPSADNSTAAVVREEGMQCFTGEAAFVPWSTILGPQFVEKYEADRIGNVLQHCYSDGTHFWRKNNKGKWQDENTESFKRYLKATFNVCSSSSKKENASEMDKILHTIEDVHRVKAGLPFLFRPEGYYRYNGEEYLNTSTTRVLTPATKETVTEWGENFEWIAGLVEYLFPGTQLDYHLSWLSRFYISGYYLQPEQGQATFQSGLVHTGKTCYWAGIIGALMGGVSDASRYVKGEDTFTAQYLKNPVMLVDDSTPIATPQDHARYSATIKKIVASPLHVYNEKFARAGQVEWFGRPVIIYNADDESSSMAPNLEMSNMDKIMLFKVGETPMDYFKPSLRENVATIQKELPYYARYLLDYQIPDHCKGNPRYGVKSYHHPDLYRASIETSASFTFLEILLDFLETQAELHEKDQDAWVGSAASLLSSLSNSELGVNLRDYTPDRVGRLLSQLLARGYTLQKKRTGRGRMWTIPYDLHNPEEDDYGE